MILACLKIRAVIADLDAKIANNSAGNDAKTRASREFFLTICRGLYKDAIIIF